MPGEWAKCEVIRGIAYEGARNVAFAEPRFAGNAIRAWFDGDPCFEGSDYGPSEDATHDADTERCVDHSA
eukprot:10601944-Karenia_brevis.AAC.1